MERRTIARALRALRRRRRWSQRTLANRLGISQPTMSRRERGALDRCRVPDLETWATALGAHLSLDIRSDGERPLSDARHAELQNWLIGLLRRAGWLADAEVSFNQYGDRGRIDIIAYFPIVGCLLVVEIKTRFTDAQEVLGRLDVKRRIAPRLAAEHGWAPTATVSALVFREDTTTRRRLAAHDELLARYALRGCMALAWLRRPSGPIPTGILLVVTPRA